MSDSKDDPFAVSRRVLIGAASATPILASVGAASPPDDVTARCDEWLALDAEIDRLLSRWSDLENALVKERRWREMTPDQREALSPTEEMDAIDKQVKGLFEHRRQGLDALPALVARDMRGVASKLQVAVKVMDHERGDGFELFKGAVAEMQHVRCAHCGAPIVESRPPPPNAK
ncbi:hypothetical protein J2X45_001391 [Caulobacter sp. BE264]|uniref:hypothetical protein n=1 Tax=Caulobacter sp. BE264 TaxID=2817724 RepID=UPI0028567F4C|nr:hypothetical protein [Caulobacter sp. BE264]MDR7230310.1 hypothetical protein [Caulobacter sp. BE264]